MAIPIAAITPAAPIAEMMKEGLLPEYERTWTKPLYHDGPLRVACPDTNLMCI